MKSVLLAVLASVLLAGCASKYRIDSLDAPATRLSRQASFYVAQPQDGRYGTKIYAGSGDMTAQAAVAALSRYVGNVERGDRQEDLSQALASAKQRGLTNVFDPMILHWEDRATQWSGKTDKITIRYSVYDTAAGQMLASSVMSASSKWATFGGDHPQDLLPHPTRQFVDKLF